MSSSARPSVVLVMGVAGAGKTTVGRLVAQRLGWAFEDADAYHDPEAVAAMQAGRGLTDEERAPWLDRLAALIRRHVEAGAPLVLACSALKAGYRRRLTEADPELWVVWLDAPRALLERRLGARTGHFAGAELLAGQLDDLEPPQNALRLDASAPPDVLANRIAECVREAGAAGA